MMINRSFHRTIRTLFIGSISLFAFFAQAQNIDPLALPPLTELVTDLSNVLEVTTLSWLNSQALAIETSTTAQIASVLFPHRNGHELFDIGMRLFRESGIGQADKNNGLLLLIATDEKKLRIIVGYGLEGTFPDIRVSDLIESTLRPFVNDGNREGAITSYHTAIQERLDQEWIIPWEPEIEYGFTMRDIAFFVIWWLITFGSFRAIRKKKQFSKFWLTPLVPFWWLFLLIMFGLPGIVGAFFGYFFWVVGGVIGDPSVSGKWGGFTPRWGGRGGGWGWSFGGGGFWWFGGWSSGWWWAGD
jgi:uncharacterized protein